MKVLILGVGSQGSVVASHLVKSPNVSEVRLADIDLEKARNLADRLKSDKVSVHKVNARNANMIKKAAKGADVLVNATSYFWNLIENSMEAALKVGANYIDLAGVKQLMLNDKWNDVGLTALIGMGEDPGISNILAASAADRLETIDEIRIKDWGSVKSKEMVSSWSPAAAWSDLAEEPIIYEDRKFKRVRPFSGEQLYNFPQPIGPQMVTWHAHEEVVTIPQYIENVKYVDFQLGIPDLPIARYVIQLGLMSKKYISVRGRRVPPRDVFITLLPQTLSMDDVQARIEDGSIIDEQECIVVETKGEKANKKIRYSAHTIMNLRESNKLMPGATALSYLVGTPAAIAAEMFGKGQIKTKGAVAPEGLTRGEREAFLKGLAGKGIRVHEESESLYDFRSESFKEILDKET